MPKDNPNAFEYKKVHIREYPAQDGITLTVRGQFDPLKRKVMIKIENDKSGAVACIKVDRALRTDIMRAIERIKSYELPPSSRDIIQQIRFEKSGCVVIREIAPYEDYRQEEIKSQYKIGDGEKCNYAFSSAEELEDFVKNLGTILGSES